MGKLKALRMSSRNNCSRPLVSASLAHFDSPPERFVGRVRVMTQASAALAPRSPWTGVIFHGMAGAGKTSCDLELAHHYKDLRRFTGFLWYSGPTDANAWSGELVRFAEAFETQLCDESLNPLLPLVQFVEGDARKFDAYLPHVRRLLEERSILLVLDNLESLLREDGQWREPRWGKLLSVLLS